MNIANINLRLAQLRKSKMMTQQQLAELLGTSFQNISKWETGVTMPDITMLPILSSIFKVSVDELLGLVPLRDELYLTEETDSAEFWDDHLDYLIRTRNGTWNPDYMNYLVRDVWKINRPVRLLDCGCGFGFLATLIMPLLPKGSTYTGIDFSKSMLNKAHQVLKENNIDGTLIHGDFLNYSSETKFDIVMCKSVLRHIGNSKPYIKKMIELASDNALIVCADSNRELECAGLYVDGMNYGFLCEHEGAIKHWETELSNNDRDYAAAMRNAYVMRELGLSDIDIRMNDKVKFVCPEQSDYDLAVDDFLAHKESWYTDIKSSIDVLVNHGMTRTEAEKYVYKSKDICDYIRTHKGEVSFTVFKGETISFGWKR